MKSFKSKIKYLRSGVKETYANCKLMAPLRQKLCCILLLKDSIGTYLNHTVIKSHSQKVRVSFTSSALGYTDYHLSTKKSIQLFSMCLLTPYRCVDVHWTPSQKIYANAFNVNKAFTYCVYRCTLNIYLCYFLFKFYFIIILFYLIILNSFIFNL